MTIEERYTELLASDSDIRDHLPKLRELASSCYEVEEFGVRAGISTVALLAGKPKMMWSYDIQAFALAGELEREAAPDTYFHFYQKNVLLMPPNECDGLFIDTVHTFEQLYKELSIHAPMVKKWIAMHDTYTYGTYGEDGGAGINAAWQKVLKKDWRVAYSTERCNGLTVLKRWRKT